MTKYRIRFQVTASASSREGILLDYLLSEDTPYPLRDMAMLSIQSFWLPLAYRDRREALTASELEQLVQSCVLRLHMQQQYLQSLLPRQPLPSGVPTGELKPTDLPESLSVTPKEKVWDPFA
ncbi:MAG: hypothetical protein AAF394_19385 [Planctomycetota bacterium]